MASNPMADRQIVIKAVQKPKLPAPIIFAIRASTASEALSTTALGSGCLLEGIFKTGSFDIRVRHAAHRGAVSQCSAVFWSPICTSREKVKQSVGQLPYSLECRN